MHILTNYNNNVHTLLSWDPCIGHSSSSLICACQGQMHTITTEGNLSVKNYRSVIHHTNKTMHVSTCVYNYSSCGYKAIKLLHSTGIYLQKIEFLRCVPLCLHTFYIFFLWLLLTTWVLLFRKGAIIHRVYTRIIVYIVRCLYVCVKQQLEHHDYRRTLR